MDDLKERARKDYIDGMKYKDIARKYGISINTVKSWKKRYPEEWNRKGCTQNEKGTPKSMKLSGAQEQKQLEELSLNESKLTEKQCLFCLYYIRSFNATQAAISAGYSPDSAHVEGSRLLRNAKIVDEIRRLKGVMQEEIFVTAMDVLIKYVEIAFANITDYVVFGKKEVPVVGMFGPLKDEDGNPVMKTVNYIEFKESTQVDGSIISEVKQGKEGVSIKLADKLKALDKLAEYFDLFPDKWKRRIEEEKLKIEKLKVITENPDSNQEGIFNFINATTMTAEEVKAIFSEEGAGDDGFIEALQGKVKEVWDDED